MIRFKSRHIAALLVFIFFFNMFIFVYPGPQSVEASFYSQHKDTIFSVLQGAVMLLVLNFILRDGGETDHSSEEDILTSLLTGGGENQTDNSEVEIVPFEEQVDEPGLSEKEDTLFELVNDLRAEHALPPLERDPELTETARLKASDMVENNYFSHQSPDYGSPFDMFQERGLDYQKASENIARAETVDKAMEFLTSNSDQRQNLLASDFNQAGFGIVESDSHGLLVVQHFISTDK